MAQLESKVIQNPDLRKLSQEQLTDMEDILMQFNGNIPHPQRKGLRQRLLGYMAVVEENPGAFDLCAKFGLADVA
ncbi:MAG: hypothetical protein Q7R49_02305 [Candidatus Daviesbacteria bacterium]|nr:hypothetical protein [Candidatus Daviesbacteria bacterium]